MSSMALPTVGSISGSSPRPTDSCSMCLPLSPDASSLGSPFFQVSLRLSVATAAEGGALTVELRDPRHRQQRDRGGHGSEDAEPFGKEHRQPATLEVDRGPSTVSGHR